MFGAWDHRWRLWYVVWHSKYKWKENKKEGENASEYEQTNDTHNNIANRVV